MASIGSASLSRIADELEAFIRTRFLVPRDDPEFGRDVDLWDTGYLDSLGVVEVVEFVQATFGVSIPPELLFDPDFVRINGMARLTWGLMNKDMTAGVSGGWPLSE